MPKLLKSVSFALASVSVIPLIVGCSDQTTDNPPQAVASDRPVADVIYTNARVYTVNQDQPWAEAFAVKDGTFLAVGDLQTVMASKGDNTVIKDLEQRMVMPGIHDMHAHLFEAGTKELFECGFPFTYSIEQILERVAGCAAQAEPGAWIRGGQWAMELLDAAQAPSKELLDSVAPNNPVLLIDSTVHAGWVNSMALNVLKIDDSTQNPTGGVISRNDAGQATGVLFDNAMYQQIYKLPMYSSEQVEQALTWSIDQFSSVGVTALKDAMVTAQSLAGYTSLSDQGQLNARIVTSLAWRMAWAGPQDNLNTTIDARESFARDDVRVNFAKIMLDGIPPARTAAIIDPYEPHEAFPADYRGYMTQSEESLIEDMIALDAMGMTVKTHATGDRSARAVLDAVEAARRANGNSGLHHEISHAEMIHPDDLHRFAELGVVAEMCPILWYPSPLHNMMEAALGNERSSRFWQVKTLVDSGALVNYGSDWPSVVPSASPWPGIEAMVTRADPYTNTTAQLAAEEAVDLETALRIFTINGAETMYNADASGSIEEGKSADFIVLDRNLFDIDATEISDTVVLQTVFEGRTVHSKLSD